MINTIQIQPELPYVATRRDYERKGNRTLASNFQIIKKGGVFFNRKMKRKELLLGKGETQKAKKQKKRYSSNTKEANQINGELFIPCRCTQQKKKKKKSVAPIHSCKGKNGTAEEMDIDQEGIHFPEEIVMDILIRLPAQSLQRFKCVSPFWCTLISDHDFIKKHINCAKNDINSQKLLTAEHPLKTNYKVEFYRFSLSSPVQVIADEQRLDWPPNCKSACTICCCCDGLVLLATSDKRTNLTYFLLWNPATRESIVLPSRDYAFPDWVFGLGYDATSDDYKILGVDLNVVDLNGDFKDVSVEILPLKSGSWRKIGKYPTGMHRVWGFLNCGMYSLAFIHGAFHWLGKSACYTIISFNISNEVYGEIPLLEQMYNMLTYDLDHGVSVLRGMLCYYSMPDSCGWPYVFKLWVMKDYGVKESWIQLHEIRDINGLGSAVPHYMFADDDVLLRLKQYGGPSKSLFWTSKRGRFELLPEPRQIIVYTESLISPKLLI